MTKLYGKIYFVTELMDEACKENHKCQAATEIKCRVGGKVHHHM